MFCFHVEIKRVLGIHEKIETFTTAIESLLNKVALHVIIPYEFHQLHSIIREESVFLNHRSSELFLAAELIPAEHKSQRRQPKHYQVVVGLKQF